MAETVDKVQERFPYLEGSLRRRFVSGCIVLVGIIFVCLSLSNAECIKQLPIGNWTIKDLITSPTIAGIGVLFVYTLGNFIELLGEIFLIRTASGIFWALNYPMRKVKKCKEKKDDKTKEGKGEKPFIIKSILARSFVRGLIWMILVPLLCLYYLVMGLIGYTYYKIHIYSYLSRDAKKVYAELPERVATGLCKPAGENTDVVWKYMVEEFENEADQKWARRAIGRVKEVLVITTALIIFFICLVVAYTIKGTQSPAILEEIHEQTRVNFTSQYEQAARSIEEYKQVIQVIKDIENRDTEVEKLQPEILMERKLTTNQIRNETDKLKKEYDNITSEREAIHRKFVRTNAKAIIHVLEVNDKENGAIVPLRNLIKIQFRDDHKDDTGQELHMLLEISSNLVTNATYTLNMWADENVTQRGVYREAAGWIKANNIKNKVGSILHLMEKELEKRNRETALQDNAVESILKLQDYANEIDTMIISKHTFLNLYMTLVVFICPISFMLIYIVYFFTLRNAITSILEMLAITQDKKQKGETKDTPRIIKK